MKRLEIIGQTGHSAVLVGESIDNAAHYLPNAPVVIITDDNVRRLYGHRFPAGEIISIGTGEAIKNLDTVRAIYERLVELQADRSIFLLGIGGGIVCDITGFAASTYMRGVRFGYIATTLLAQVDASVGGKTGVNFKGYKNMVGVFSQPEFVICDPRVLSTLTESELASGFAEIVKHAAIADAGYFDRLESQRAEALILDSGVLEQIIYDSVAIKSEIVNRDEREKGERQKLNYGHTLGHALEKTAGLRHGEAVSIGMIAAARVSLAMGMLAKEDVKRMVSLLSGFNLPTAVTMDVPGVIDALARDKKRHGDTVNIVLLSEIGNAVIERIPLRTLEAVLVETANGS